MKIHFYGTRGSIPSPLTLKKYKQKIKKILDLYAKSDVKDVNKFISKLPFELSHIYGGNTSCTVIEEEKAGKNEHIILDAGSGIRVFGNEFIGKKNNVFHVFMSHFHLDHICGIPFFKPIYNPSNKVIFYSSNKDIHEILKKQHDPAFFPMPFDKLPADKQFVILKEDDVFEFNGFSVRNIPLKHPGGSTGYIFEGYGKKVSYLTDTEFTPENLKDKELFYKACIESSDVAIIDSQYHLIEFFNKFDWGHTSSNMAVNLALDWRVKILVLFHFDPDHTDEELVKILKEANEQKDFFNKRKIKIIQAIEGAHIEF